MIIIVVCVVVIMECSKCKKDTFLLDMNNEFINNKLYILCNQCYRKLEDYKNERYNKNK